jgi:Flp pilus assembly protein TadB
VLSAAVWPEGYLAASVAAAVVCFLAMLSFSAACRSWRSSPARHHVAFTLTASLPVTHRLSPIRVDQLLARLRRLPQARAIERKVSMRTYDPDLAEALDRVARQLHAGETVTSALATAAGAARGTVGRDLRSVAAGAPVVGLDAALAGWTAERRTPAAEISAAVLAIGFRTGGATARALDQSAAAIRQRAAAVAEARSLTAQARLSATVLSLAPVVFAAVVSSIDPAVGSFLVATPTGALLIMTGLALDVAGWFWMRRLVAAVAW